MKKIIIYALCVIIVSSIAYAEKGFFVFNDASSTIINLDNIAGIQLEKSQDRIVIFTQGEKNSFYVMFPKDSKVKIEKEYKRLLKAVKKKKKNA